MKPEIDRTVGLNNYVLFYDRDSKGNLVEYETKKNKENKKYCIISRCNGYKLEDGTKTTTLIEIKNNNGIGIAYAEIVMFIFDTYEEMKEVIEKVTLTKKDVKEAKGDRIKQNKKKNERNNNLSNVLKDMITKENIENKKVFAFAEDSRYCNNKDKIGLIDVCRTDENGNAVSVGVEQRRQCEGAKGVGIFDRIDENNILSLFYADIEEYIKNA